MWHILIPSATMFLSPILPILIETGNVAASQVGAHADYL